MFGSHSSTDLALLRDLERQLSGSSVDLWLSEDRIGVGENYAQAITEAISRCDGLFVLLSHAALDSDDVQREVSLALGHKKPIFPVLAPGVRIDQLSLQWQYWLQIAQATNWADAASTAHRLAAWEAIASPGRAAVAATPRAAETWNQPPGPEQPQRPGLGRRVVIVAGAAVVLAAVALIALPQLSGRGGAPAAPMAAMPSADPPAQTVGPSQSVAPAKPNQAGAVTPGACVGTDGTSVTCNFPTAALVVAASPCQPDAALRGLGVDPGARQLDVAASTVAGACVLAPGKTSGAAGATAEDIRRVVAGETIPVLSLCYATNSGPEVACSQPHLIEYVGRWQPYDGHSSASILCDGPARAYANRTFDSPTEELKLVLLTGGGQYRCGISVASPINKSVWGVGGAALR